MRPSPADALLGPPKASGHVGEAGLPTVGYFTREQLECWARGTRDAWVLSTLSQGYRLQFHRRPPIPGRVKWTVIHDPVKARALESELATLLDKGAIVPIDPLREPGGFYSRYFLVPKKTGDLRPVLDLRGLNVFLKRLPFHMLKTGEMLQAISPGDWFTSIDLKDAYFHVPIVACHQQFLRFAFQGRHYQFRVLPFGLSLSPRVFSRCVAAALAPLQERGLRILPYLDDWLICAPSYAQAVRDTRVVLSHIEQLGLRVNLAKSSLVPTRQTVFLGVALDSVTMSARPSVQRVDSIMEMLGVFRAGRLLPYVLYLRLLGKLTAAATVVPLGLLSLRSMQMWLNGFCLDPSRLSHRYERLRVSAQCLESLLQWRDRSWVLSGVPLGSLPSRRETVHTDASPTGWGATWQGRVVQGPWSPALCGVHINVLELMAVRLALGHFLPVLRGGHVMVRSDSTTVVHHINHSGGTRSPRLVLLTRQLLTWAAPHFLSLRAMHIPGPRNVVADFLSRQRLQPGEWRLHPEVVARIWGMFGRAGVDLFASRDTTHCALWFSLMEGDSPLGLDALAHSWPRTLLYAFPPIPLIFPTLLRVLQEGHRLILVAPYWPGRIWFPLLHSLCCSPPSRLPSRRDLLSQLGGRLLHPNPARLQLWVWPLQGRGFCSLNMVGT